MSNKINTVQISGTSYSIEDSGATRVLNVTQAEYDALVTGGTVDPTVLYNITDATSVDISQYWTSAQTNSAITQAVSGKQDTLVSGTNIKTINNESILGSGNIDIQGGGSITIDPSLDSGSTNAVANSAITNAINAKVDTSAITTTITSSSTNSEVPSAKAVYDQLGGLKLVKLTQSAYDALSPNYDNNTLYLIIN